MFKFTELPKPEKKRRTRSDKAAIAFANYKRYNTVRNSINGLMYNTDIERLKDAGIEIEQFEAFLTNIKKAYLNSFHSFYTCTSCSEKLTGRAVRKDAKIQTFAPCTFCGAVHDPFEDSPQPKVIFKRRSKFTRGEAIEIMRTKYPEVLL